ncbi:methyl-accepting chemotaxis protein [Vibrio sp. CAU 1672]|nr:methyl-accepting chemotaxis protein [Vibrio sp. CAU 1672]
MVATCLLASNFLSYINLKKNTIQSINDQSTSIVRYEANKIETWFHDNVNILNSLTKNYTPDLPSERFVDIAKITKEANGLTSVLYGFDDGRSYADYGIDDPDEFDPRTRDWYQQAKSSNGVTVTDAYVDALTGSQLVSLAEKVEDAVILIDIDLDILSQTVKYVNFPGAVTAILDDTGKALASNSSALTVGTRLSDVGMEKVHRTMLAEDESVVSYTLNGVEKLSFTKTIKLVDGRKWHLFVGIDKSLAYAEVDKALNDAVISSLIMLTAGIILAITILNVLYRPILTLKDMVLDLSKGNGDLTRRLPLTSNDDLGQISEGINVFITNLQSLMLEVSQSSEHISGSVEQLKHQTDANTEVLKAHSTETEQIVTAIEEMSATAVDVANNAADASQSTDNASSQATNSKDVVNSATSTISQLVDDVEHTSVSIVEIEKDTLEITNVLKVIGEIADQTNLLALNAAIEAARAGEQGRGFAVVADEVRALAARTQSSTAEIEQTLNKLRNGSGVAISAMKVTKSTCERAVENASMVADDLDTIAQSVVHINDLNTQIATAAEQQSSVAGEITRNMTSIREIVSELSANGEATASETVNLAAANSQLKSVVSKFKLQ